MSFFEIFEQLCGEKGVTPTQAARDVGIAQPVVSQWKKRGSTPKAETVQKLAGYFGVSANYLLGQESERVVIPGRLKFVEINDPDSKFMRYDIEASDPDALAYGLQILERAGVPVHAYTPQVHILSAMEKLNYDGQQKAVERVVELTEIPRYQAQVPASAPPPAPEGRDTTPSQEGSEGPQEGK